MERTKNRWLILIAAILVNVSLGTGYVWSIFQAALLKVNESAGWVKPQTSLAFSISFAMVPIAMTIFGPIIDKHGPKKVVMLAGILFGSGMILTGLFAHSIPVLYITYGLLLGFGIGTGYGAATATTVKWFPDKKGLAGGLTAAGFGSGAVFLAPIIRQLIASRGVYATFVILGVIFLIVICIASFFLEKPPVAAKVTNAPSGKKVKEMIRDVNFWILFVIYTMAATSGMMMNGHVGSIVTDYKIIEATSIVVIFGLANTAGRIFWGFISDKIGRYVTVICMFLVSAIGLLLLTFNQTVGPVPAVIGIAMIALSFGGFLGAFPGITAENWGVANAGANYGVMFFAYGIAAIIGPTLAANIQQSTGDYSLAFVTATCMAIVGIVLTIFFIFKKKKEA